MRLPIWTGVVAAAVGCSILLAGCGDERGDVAGGSIDEVAGVAGPDVVALDPGLLPDQVLGLEVAVEDVSEQYDSITQSYVEALTLFSFRRDEVLQATLQVTRLIDAARVDDPSFRRTLISRLGSTEPQEVVVGERTVSLTTGTDQRVQAWFVDNHLFILSIRANYDQPRRLLRTLLEVEP